MRRHPLGIIDALGEGFSISRRALVALSIPVALDLLLWLGPRLQPAPTIVEALSRGGPAPYAQLLTGSTDGLASGMAGLNLVALLVLGLVTVPSLMVVWQPPFAAAVPVWQAQGWSGTLVAGAALFLLGLLLGVAYLVLIVRELEREEGGEGRRSLLADVGRSFVRLVQTGVILLLVLLGVAAPLSLVIGLLGQVSAGAASMAVMVSSGAALAVWFYLFFTVNAVVLTRVGPLRAMWYSFSVVRLNLWRVVALVLLMNVIVAGLGVVWRAIGQLHPLTTVAAITANALVGTAMAAASLAFYRDRHRLWMACPTPPPEKPPSGRPPHPPAGPGAPTSGPESEG